MRFILTNKYFFIFFYFLKQCQAKIIRIIQHEAGCLTITLKKKISPKFNLYRPQKNSCPACNSPLISFKKKIYYYDTIINKHGASKFTYVKLIPEKYLFLWFDLWGCSICGLIFVIKNIQGFTELIEKSDIYYSKIAPDWLKDTQGIYEAMTISEIFSNASKKNHSATILSHYTLIKNHWDGKGAFLEIGANMGGFSFLISSCFPGARITACETNSRYVEIARKKYKNLKIIDFELGKQKINEKFDIIYLNDVIEHIWDLDSFILNIKNHLNIFGKVLIGTPNINCLESKVNGTQWWGYIVPHHCQLFSRTSLATLMNRFGFIEIDYIESTEQEFISVYKLT